MFYREKCLHVCKSYAQHIHDLKKVELESRKNAWSQCSISLVPRTFLIIRTTGDGKREGREGRVQQRTGLQSTETLICNACCNCMTAKWVTDYSHHAWICYKTLYRKCLIIHIYVGIVSLTEEIAVFCQERTRSTNIYYLLCVVCSWSKEHSKVIHQNQLAKQPLHLFHP